MSRSDTTQQSSFWTELRRRKVGRVAVSYLVAGWMIVEASLAVFEAFDVPAWADRAIILTVLLGFPAILLLAWLVEFTPQGLKLTSTVRAGDAAATPEFQQRSNRLAMLAGGLLPALLVGGVLGGTLIYLYLAPDPAPTEDTQLAQLQRAAADNLVVAVLPLVNMSADDDNAFFADGVHEEILTNLSRVDGLRVISRTSVMGYAGSTGNIREIAAELGASHVVEGSVRRAGDRVRVTAQLIDAATDEHLWADNFDRELEDIFAVQSDVAEQIARALDLQLARGDNPGGTRSIEAYDRYLQALAIQRDAWVPEPEANREAIRLLREAVAIDPQFARAWGVLTRAHARTGFNLPTEAEAQNAQAREAAQRVATLVPGTADALLAQMWVTYYVDRAYEEALATLRQARALRPNEPEMIEAEAYLLQRLGRWDEAQSRFRQAMVLDPLNTNLIQQMALSLRTVGRYDEILDMVEARRELLATGPGAELSIEHVRLEARPNLVERVQWVNRVVDGLPDSVRPGYGFSAVSLLLHLDRLEDAQAVRQVIGYVTGIASEIAVDEYHQSRAHAMHGREDAARRVGTQALERILDQESRAPERADDYQNLIVKGYLGAWLGRDDVAAPAIARIAAHMQSTDDAVKRMEWEYWLMQTLVAADPERAIELFLAAQARGYGNLSPTRFISTIHLWYPMLADARVRALFEDYPLHAQYLRDLLPEAQRYGL